MAELFNPAKRWFRHLLVVEQSCPSSCFHMPWSRLLQPRSISQNAITLAPDLIQKKIRSFRASFHAYAPPQAREQVQSASPLLGHFQRPIVKPECSMALRKLCDQHLLYPISLTSPCVHLPRVSTFNSRLATSAFENGQTR